MKRHTVAMFATMLVTGAQAADTPPRAPCATPEQAKTVQALYATTPMPAAFMAAPKLGLPEGVVLSALPAERAVGTPGAAFLDVWRSLQTWDRSLTLVLKGGQVFEIFGRIPPGEPSRTSRNYNLAYPEAGLGGHLRPDLISAIYAVNLAGREGPMRGVTFLDEKGDSAFHVFLPESRKPTAAEVAQYAKTRELIASLPRSCP